MRIRTTVKLATIIIISVVLVYGAFAVAVNRSVGTHSRDLRTATDIRINLQQLRGVTSDYVLYRTERARQQWGMVYKGLLNKLSSPEYQSFEKKYRLLDLGDSLKLLAETFTKLSVVMGKTGLPAPEAEAKEELQNRLITQIMVTSRELGTSFDKISKNISENMVTLQRRSTWLEAIALLILILFILGNSIFLAGSVVKPVLQLHAGAEIIGGGNLDHKVGINSQDEVGQLSRAFDRMTANLQEITVSRDELVREMEERQRAEKDRLASEARFKAFMDNSPTIAWAKDEAGRYAYLSKTYQDRFGVRWEDWQGKTEFELWPREIAESFKKNDLAVLACGQAIDVIEETVNPDGSRCSWWNFKFPFYDAAGVRYVGGIGVDITERKRAEEALLESEQRLRRFYESGLFGVIYWNMNGEVTDANDKFLEMVGYQREDLTTGRIDWRNMTPLEYRHLDEASVKELQATGVNETLFEKEFIRQDGTRLPVILAGAMLDEARFHGVAFVLDITERKRSEEAIERLASFPRLNPNPVLEVDFSGNITYSNPATLEVLRQLGLSEDISVFLPDDMAAILKEAGETGKSRFYREMAIGKAIFALYFFFPADLHVVRIYSIDITQRTRAEEALRQAHAELEDRVIERTEELNLAVARLKEEVTERQQAEKAVRESEQTLRYLASKILTAQEDERNRIAMDLHEGLGQSMSALKLYLRAIQQHLPTEAVQSIEDFDSAHNLLKEMIEEVRRISDGLSPVVLENLGLTAALEHLGGELSKLQKVTMDLDIDSIENLFSPQTEINLFRVFQESFHNIAKHAKATQLSVTIKRENDRVNFLIKDDGVGFDLKQIRHKKSVNKGMGLASMEERLRMIGALLNIKSQTGVGTEISFSIPIVSTVPGELA